MEFSDKITALCLEVYSKLGKSGKPIENKEWTLLSAIVKEVNGDLEVVSLATGTKCIGKKSLCPEGTVVNDSHAEVLSRRALLRYIYHQISLAKSGDSSSILKRVGQKYVINDGIKWHMYTSQVPCGDASIIPMENLPETCEPPPKRQRVDIHRTGAKPVSSDPRQDRKGPGPEYHTKGAVRIKPGRGDPTLSLSCSDKMARWIYVGLQGALLSHLLEGCIKLSTITVGGGSPFDADLINNSLITRANTKVDIPKILQSSLEFSSSLEKVKGGKPAPSSLIWCKVSERPLEVSVDGRRLGATKKHPLKGMLKVCKRELFKTFLELSQENLQKLTYREIKDCSLSYQMSFTQFKTNMGSWSEKPALEHFSLQL